MPHSWPRKPVRSGRIIRIIRASEQGRSSCSARPVPCPAVYFTSPELSAHQLADLLPSRLSHITFTHAGVHRSAPYWIFWADPGMTVRQTDRHSLVPQISPDINSHGRCGKRHREQNPVVLSRPLPSAATHSQCPIHLPTPAFSCSYPGIMQVSAISSRRHPGRESQAGRPAGRERRRCGYHR
jgi:hypothetical protein